MDIFYHIKFGILAKNHVLCSVKQIKNIPIVSGLCVAVLCYAWSVLCLQKADYLYQVQNFSPWLGTRDYLLQFAGHPGGLREWAGDWLTQFFFYPWLGATIMVACWAIAAWLFVKANRLEGWWQTLSLIPVVALLTSIIDLGYWIFCLKTRSYWFGPTLGLLAVSIVQFVYSRCGEHGRLLSLVLMILVGYPLLGWFAPLGVLSMLICSPWKRPKAAWLKLICATGAASIAIMAFYFHSPAVRWREVAVLYGFPHMASPDSASLLLEIPFWTMAASILLIPLLARLQKTKALSWLPVLLVVITLMGSNMLNYRNTNFHTELRMLRALDEGRWDDVLSEIRTARKPTRQMVISKDVALAQKGRLGDEAFDYPIGGSRPQMNIDLPIHMAHSAAPLFYYWLGIPNYAFVWSMENYIEYGMSPFYLRMMYRCMVANGEREAAQKYKTLLGTTLFHRNYEVPDMEVRAVQRFMTGHDQLTNDRGYSEKYLLERLSQETYDTPEAQQIAVHFAILARSQSAFERALSRYQSLLSPDPSGEKPLPKYFNQKTFEWYYESNTGNKSY